MLEYLPHHLREHLETAYRRRTGRRTRLRVELGGAVFPLTRFWQDGFAMEARLAPARMRGLVDVYDGSRHIFQCLIVASETEEGELICLFKRATAVTGQPALDYWRDENAPVGYLPKM